MKKAFTLMFLSVLILITSSFNNLLLSDIQSGLIQKGVFYENKGQWDGEIIYAMKGENVNVALTEKGILFDFYEVVNHKGSIKLYGHVVNLNFLDGNISDITPENKLSAKLNYFYGNDPSKWLKGIESYSSLMINDVYEGIDARIVFDNGNPRYDFIVNPGADPTDIEFRFSGCDKQYLSDNGNIILKTSLGNIQNGKIYAYQVKEGIKRQVDCIFEQSDDSFGFIPGDYDPDLPLIIDPIVFSSFFGASEEDEIVSVATDDDGNYYMFGWTKSVDFNTTEGAYQKDYNYDKDMFISKIKIDGFMKELVFSTLLGSNAEDIPSDIALDSDGNIYICGSTNSVNFPMINGFSFEFNGAYDCVLAKMSNDGSELIYSNVFGGSKEDRCNDFEVTDKGVVYAVGFTKSSNFPVNSPYQNKLQGQSDAFYLKLNKSGTYLDLSSYFGGFDDENAYAVSIDINENIFIAGSTSSSDFPVYPLQTYGWYLMKAPFDHLFNGNTDAFVINLLSSGSLEYATFFGGKNHEVGTNIYANDDGTCYLAGWVESAGDESEFPVSQIAVQNEANGGIDGFVAKIDALREEQSHWPQYNRVYQDISFCTYLGGSDDDYINHIYFSKEKNTIMLCGETSSSDFPNNKGMDIPTGEGINAFFTHLSSDATTIDASTVFGFSGNDKANSFVNDEAFNLFLVGSTSSEDFMQKNSIQETYGGGETDGFFIFDINAELKIETPDPGDDYCTGDKLTISWTTTGISSNEDFRIEIKKSEAEEWTIIEEDVDVIEYNWDIPVDFESGEYLIRVSHISGATTIMSSGFNVRTNPEILSLEHTPENLDLCEGESVTFYAECHGDELQYQWRKNGKAIDGATTSELVLQDLTHQDAGEYDLVLKGACNPSDMSDKYQVSVMNKPKVISHTEELTVMEYEKISLSVEAEGDDLEYQWYIDSEIIIGANKSTFEIASAKMEHTGDYTCMISNDCGEVSTEIIKVKVEESIDVNDSDPNINNSIDIIVYGSVNTGDRIKYSVFSSKDEEAVIHLVDINGNVLKELFNGRIMYGENPMHFDTSDLSSGIYWINLKSDGEMVSVKVSVLK